MTSYTPESYYGAIPDANGRWTGKFGLVPWPTHLRPREQSATEGCTEALVDLGHRTGGRAKCAPAASPESNGGVELTKKGERYCAANALPDIDLRDLFGEGQPPILTSAGGVFFLTLTRDRASIAYTIERLINMLDTMEDDPDFEATGDDEPSLGAPERHPESFEALFGGVALPRTGILYHHCGKGQEKWAQGRSDEREVECEGEGEQVDDERSYGWANEGSQTILRDSGEENDLGSTEEINQVRRLEIDNSLAWLAEDGEPLLGWCENAGMGAEVS